MWHNKTSRSNQCLQYAAETERTRRISETNGFWRQKSDHIQCCRAKKVIMQDRQIVPNSSQARIEGQKGFTLCWVGVEANHLLLALPIGQTLNSITYGKQLYRLKHSMDQRRRELASRKGVVFHRDNARPRTSSMTRQKVQELGWEISWHPPYSPDIAPSDYPLFLSIAGAIGRVKLYSLKACEKWLSEFFANKEQGFYGGVLWCCSQDRRMLSNETTDIWTKTITVTLLIKQWIKRKTAEGRYLTTIYIVIFVRYVET